MSDPEVARIAKAFGCEVVVNGVGPANSYRREACKAGCPTIVLEAGEVWKVEPSIVESAERGVKNVLIELGMLDGETVSPPYQLVLKKTQWIRAEKGGFLQFHISPGDVVEKDQPLASNTTLLGRERSVLTSPFDGVVIGMTTLPAISPGEPVCNLGKLPRNTNPEQLRRKRTKEGGLEERTVEELSSNVMVTEPTEPGQN